MFAYIARRLALIPLTLIGIITLNFLIVQVAPGGPVEQFVAKIQGIGGEGGPLLGGGETSAIAKIEGNSTYRGRQGLDPEFIRSLEAIYGFDKPAYERYWMMVTDYLTFDLGESYYRAKDVAALIVEKLPVSISLGLWSTLIIYLISIPLGIRKAVRDGSRFDVATSSLIVVGYAIPGFLFAILLIVLFAGGRYFDWFPLRGLTSENWDELTMTGKAFDYLWHMVLPVIAMSVSGFASLTMLTKNSFLEEINKHYVLTARAKGLSEQRVLYRHIFRNAMLLVIAGFPAALIGLLFTSSVLIEVIFSLDGLGLLGFESTVNRDYPVIFGSLYIFSLIGLLLNLISDIVYHMVDPRIDFETREV
jgi:microcin C transport system permease protein